MMLDITTTLLINAAVFTALFCLMMLIRRLLANKISAALQYALWAVVVIKLVIPFGYESSLSPMGLFAASDKAAADTRLDAAAAYTPSDYYGADTPVETQAGTDRSAEIPENVSAGVTENETAALNSAGTGGEPAPETDWTAVIFALWAAGMLAVGAMMAFDAFRMRRKIEKTPPSLRVMRIFEACRRELGIRRKVDVIVQPVLGTPLVMNAFRPALVLPGDIETQDDGQIRHICMHELTHVRRGDLAVIMALNVLSAVYWFNPFTWLCFRLIRKDMEVACDCCVLERLGRSARRDYIGTVLRFAGMEDERRQYAAMGMADGRLALERRIRGMFRKTRTGVKGRVTAASVAVLMLAACTLTACQPTPDKEIISQKDALEQSVESMPQQEETFVAPETWKDEIMQSATDNKVVVNASVVCPDYQSANIYNIRPRNFTQQEVDEFIEYFVGDAALYNGEYQETKDILEAQILEMQQVLTMSKEEIDAAFGYTEEELQQQLEDLQARYAAAPEEESKTIVTSKLTNDKDGFELLDVYADNGGSDDALIEVFNLVGESSNSASFSIRLRDESAGGTLLSYSGEPEEVAQAVLSDMGINNVHFVRSAQAAASNDPGNDETVTRLFYELTINGLPLRQTCSLIEEDEREYAAALWRTDTISFDVSENGLTSFSWRQHGEITETVKENAALLPFEQIMQKFEEYIFLQPIWGYEQEAEKQQPESYTYNISSIELCMAAVPQKDAQGQYLLVPAWNFYGYMEYTIPEEFSGYSEKFMHEMGLIEPEQRTDCFMTLSAVDGTLLHR